MFPVPPGGGEAATVNEHPRERGEEARPGAGARRPWPRRAAVLGLVALLASVAVAYAVTAGRGDRPPRAERPGIGGTDGGQEGATFAPRAGSGRRAPDFTLPAFPGPGTVSLSDFRGTPLVLNFWASWCPFCIDEMPDFEEVHSRFRGQVAFLGVNLQDDVSLATELADRTGVTYTLAQDADGSLFARVGGLGMPTTVLITADGHIADIVSGPIDGEALEERIREHLVVEV